MDLQKPKRIKVHRVNKQELLKTKRCHRKNVEHTTRLILIFIVKQSFIHANMYNYAII